MNTHSKTLSNFQMLIWNRGSEALADFELMFSNCYLYNKPTDDVTLMCQEVESFFKTLVKKVPEPEVEITPPEPAPKGAKATPKSTPKNAKKQRPPPVAAAAKEPPAEPDEDVKSRLNSSGLAGGEQQPILKQGRRGIKRPDMTTVQENDKKRPRKRKRWWSGCKEFVNFLFLKKHESMIPIPFLEINEILEFAFPFYEPVDHVSLKLNDYTKIIKVPMDLGTIRKKLDSDQYAEHTDVYKDLQVQVVTNRWW